METNEIKTGSIISLILGVIGLFIFGIICGIGAIAFGIGKDDNIAKVGMILGVIDVVLIIVIACMAY
jgi:hypothetical protein